MYGTLRRLYQAGGLKSYGVAVGQRCRPVRSSPAYRHGVRARVWMAVMVLLCSTGASSDEAIEANLEVVGRWRLEAAGVYDDVTVVGTTMVVAVEGCDGSVQIVDGGDPAKPKLVASIPLPIGATAIDLDSVNVVSEGFTGDLLTVAFAPCAGGAPTSVGHFDITDPANPRSVGQRGGGHSISIAQRPDGRILAVRTTGGGVAIDDLSDPRNPFEYATWAPPTPTGGCGPAAAQLYEDGERAVAVIAGGVYDLDLIEPTRPSAFEPAAGAGGRHVGILPLGNRTIAVVAEDGTCPPAGPGLRVLRLERGGAPVDEAPLRYAGIGAPGRLVASGGYAYVTWGGAGLRVVDFAEVRPKTVAQFVPVKAAVVAVGLLPQHVVVSDANQGLIVLERPDEGGGRATFWTQFVDLLPYIGGAVILSAALLLPRMLASRAGATVRMPVPGAEPVRRRRRA